LDLMILEVFSNLNDSMMRANGLKLQHGRFRLDIRKNFLLKKL